tara:strand:- start:51 stop:626 length:576 start_codon:yes stop_codon:yes gene_type:complete
MKKLILTIIAFMAVVKNLVAAEAGMPQLDPTFWASQAFWLILVFTLLYLALSNLFIPKIKGSIDDRENKMKSDLDEAQKLKDMAERKLKEYEKTIENGKKEVQKILFDSKKQLISEIASKKKTFDKEIELEIETAQKEIQHFKKESLNNISKISEEMTSKIIQEISGEDFNQSSIKAAVKESSKINLGKYL